MRGRAGCVDNDGDDDDDGDVCAGGCRGIGGRNGRSEGYLAIIGPADDDVFKIIFAKQAAPEQPEPHALVRMNPGYDGTSKVHETTTCRHTE